MPGTGRQVPARVAAPSHLPEERRRLMPSAEPARPAIDPASPPGTVIRIDRRTARTGAGRRTPQPPAADSAVVTPQQHLAAHMESMFLNHGRTLSDPGTAEAYRIALDAVLLMLEGSFSERLIGEAEYAHLSGMVLGMRQAPDTL